MSTAGVQVKQSVLVIRSGALGDTILTIPLLESVQARHPDSTITFLGNGRYRDLIPPGIEVRAIDDPECLWMFGNSRDLREGAEESWDKAYVVSAKPERLVANLFAAGTKEVSSTTPLPIEGKHIVESIHEGLGLPVPAPRAVLRRLASSERRDLIWVHPGSGGPSKCLSLELMAEFAQNLSEHTGLRLAVTSGEADGFLKAMPEWERLITGHGTVLFEDRPLTELCKVLGGARLFVGNDSGVGHLAAGLGIPSIVFFAATDPVNWAPWVPAEQLTVLDLRGGPESLPPQQEFSHV
jgi:heptosyltransferase III